MSPKGLPSLFMCKKVIYCMAEGGVFIGHVLQFWSEEIYLFPHYRKSFCIAACFCGEWLFIELLAETSDLVSMTL